MKEKNLKELEERLEKLRKILIAEKLRIEKEVLSRERFPGEVVGEVGDFSILRFERRIEPGTFLGCFSDGEVQPYGFVIDSSFDTTGSVAVVKRISATSDTSTFVEAESTALYDVQLDMLDAFDIESVKPLSEEPE